MRGGEMAESIECPNCKSKIPLQEAIAHQIDEELAARVASKEQEFEAREGELLPANVRFDITSGNIQIH
jgi:hypothetical protein